MQCKVCQQLIFSEVTFSNLFHNHNLQLCSNCQQIYQQSSWQVEQINQHKHYYLFDYHSNFKQLIHDYKFKGDLILGDILAPLICQFFNEHHFDLIIPIPISQTRKIYRTFNQCEKLLTQAGIKYHPILFSHYRQHQFSLTKQQRRDLENPFYLLNDSIVSKDISICIFDDIYTTGQTIRHAIDILRKRTTIVTLAKVNLN